MLIKIADLPQILPALEKKITDIEAVKSDEQHVLLRRIDEGIRTNKVLAYNTLCSRLKELNEYLNALVKLTEDTDFNLLKSLTFLGNGLNLDEADFGRMLAVRDLAEIITSNNNNI